VITRPHDDFVRQLLTSDDVLRQLGLVPVSSVVGAESGPARVVGAGSGIANGRAAPVRVTESLRAALSAMLQSGAPSLTVVDDAGTVVGRLSFEDIRQAVLAGRAATPP
jgi:ABC-type proline/glycine betaine transport system ATPase subunit